MIYSNQFFTDIFRILGNRIRFCGQSHQDGTALDLHFARVHHFETTIIPHQFRLEYNNQNYIEEVKQFTASDEVGIQIDYREDHLNVTLLNNMDVTIVNFQIKKEHEEYLKLKLAHS